MDKVVKVRFFKIGRASESDPRLADILQSIGNIDDVEKREKQLSVGFDVRLEVFDKEGADVIVGEMTRIQSTNMPSHISKGKRAPLKDVDRLGHSIVFRYNTKTSILGIQHDRQIMPIFRFFQYVEMWEPNGQFKSEPVVRSDMWERFARAQPRTLEIAIAEPANLSAVGKAAEPLRTSLVAMGQAYSAPSISVRIAMGYERGSLASSVKDMVEDLLSRRAKGEIQIKKLKALAAAESGTDPINLLEELLEYKEELELHNKDPDTNYSIKLAYIKRCMGNVN